MHILYCNILVHSLAVSTRRKLGLFLLFELYPVEKTCPLSHVNRARVPAARSRRVFARLKHKKLWKRVRLHIILLLYLPKVTVR